jgi:hypothetical protein
MLAGHGRRIFLGLIVAIGVAVALTVVLVTRPGSSPQGHSSPTAQPSGSAGGSTGGPQPVGAATPPSCTGAGRVMVRPLPAGNSTPVQIVLPSPKDDVTVDLSSVTSTAYPSTRSPIAVGTGTTGQRTCVSGGTVLGAADPQQTWTVYHGQYNAACVKILARDWMEVRGLRCDNVEDGIRPEESGVNANNAVVYVTGTYLTRMRDDCIENDYTVGGLLQDNLWEQCNTGISERPSGKKSWSTPPDETLTLDHMLIGLYQTPHDQNGQVVMGENALFKWSSSGNRVVIKCSIFKVDAVSLNGTDSMALPPRTTVDDSACPDTPSTLVWLGPGDYPAPHAGLRVVKDVSVWDAAVSAWKAAHQEVARVAPAVSFRPSRPGSSDGGPVDGVVVGIAARRSSVTRSR